MEMGVREALPRWHVVWGLLFASSQWVHMESRLLHLAAAGPPVRWNPIRPTAKNLLGPRQIHRLTLLPFEGIQITTSPLGGGYAVGAVVQVLANAFILLPLVDYHCTPFFLKAAR